MKKKGFTLIELLVVVAIIALLISILLPSLSRARELAKRAVCGSNQRGIGQGMHIYSNDNEEWFMHHYYESDFQGGTLPTTTGVTFVGTMGSTGNVLISQETKGDDGTTGAVGETTSHPSRSMFLLVTGGQSTPGQFICPSSADQQDDLRNRQGDASVGQESAAQPGRDRFDFRGYSYLSYGYQLPYGRFAKPRQSLDVRMPIVADKSPYFEVDTTNAQNSTDTDQRSGKDAPTGWESLTLQDLLRKSNEDWRPYNSPNHNEEGQNILFVDGHVEFAKTPAAGVNNDNIYTIHNTDLDKQKYGVVGGIMKKAATWGPSTNTDSFLVP